MLNEFFAAIPATQHTNVLGVMCHASAHGLIAVPLYSDQHLMGFDLGCHRTGKFLGFFGIVGFDGYCCFTPAHLL